MSFCLKKNKQNKSEWLLQQNHRVDGLTEDYNERMDTKDVVKRLVKKAF